MKDALKFYIENFFKLDRRVGYKRYREQEWIPLILMIVPAILIFFALTNSFADFSSEKILELSDKELLKTKKHEFLMIHISFYILFFTAMILAATNEIQRFNFRKVS